MRRMNTRQATKQLVTLFIFLATFTACSPLTPPVPTPTRISSISSPIMVQATLTELPTVTVTPSLCRTQPGRIEEGSLDSLKPPQDFQIYLPPCYDETPDQRYPVLYLLHGQTYTDDQWIRLGAARVADELTISGESRPFIIVFPDNRYWNQQSELEFGNRLVNDLIPYIDSTYRTLPDRNHRAIGGMSRGAGWSLRIGLTQWKLFGAIGLHSLAVLQKDGSKINGWVEAIPASSRPQIFMDIGDADQELASAQRVESLFSEAGILHEWHLYGGAHTEDYWSAHIEEYMSWYAGQWNNP